MIDAIFNSPLFYLFLPFIAYIGYNIFKKEEPTNQSKNKTEYEKDIINNNELIKKIREDIKEEATIINLNNDIKENIEEETDKSIISLLEKLELNDEVKNNIEHTLNRLKEIRRENKKND